MSAQASLAEAEAARRTQERKQVVEQPVRDRVERLIAENNLAALLREALLGGER